MEPVRLAATHRKMGWGGLFDLNVAGSGESSVPFLSVAHAVAEHASVVAEVGCGRGGWADSADGLVPLQDFRGPRRRVIGIDIDPIGEQNPMIDEFRRIDETGRWPLDDTSVDLAVSDWTLEHVQEPDIFVAELTRVLTPGGIFVARTVSRYSPLSIAARVVPNDRHVSILSRLQPDRDAKDVFPTAYLMNSHRELHRLLDRNFDWSVSHRSDLSQYFLRWPRIARVIAATEPHLPNMVRSTLVLHARKRGAPFTSDRS